MSRSGLIIFGVVFVILLVEVTLQLIAPQQPYHHQQQLRAARNLYIYEQGGECVQGRDELHNHPHFGVHRRVLQPECARSFFFDAPSGTVKVVFLGGSVMANDFSEDYNTTIDTAVHKIFAQHGMSIRSLNLAESGSRLTNELIRLLLEVLDLKPDVVVFLDGYNEFSQLRYGGAPQDDYYWSVRGNDLINDPSKALLKSLTLRSKLLQTILWDTGVIDNPLSSVGKLVKQEDVAAAALQYVKSQKQVELVCRSYGLRCEFFLQPTIFMKRHLSDNEKRIVSRVLNTFPEWDNVLRIGYDRILHKLTVTPFIEEFEQASNELFIDDVHVNAAGNAMLGNKIALNLMQSLS